MHNEATPGMFLMEILINFKQTKTKKQNLLFSFVPTDL